MGEGRPLTVGLLEDVHGRLVRGTRNETEQPGRLRTIQVVIGGSPAGRVQDARFVPQPPGDDLARNMRDWVAWVQADRTEAIDPVVSAGIAHYHFEATHPFHDGNGRIGRLLVVLHLQLQNVLSEPTLTVSPWFEARRAEYHDRLLAVSTTGAWDPWIRFFADGLAASAQATKRLLLDLLAVQSQLKAAVREGGLRADSALQLVDFSLDQPVPTVRQVQRRLGVTYARANALVRQLVGLGVRAQYDDRAVYDRDFYAPDVLAVLVRGQL